MCNVLPFLDLGLGTPPPHEVLAKVWSELRLRSFNFLNYLSGIRRQRQGGGMPGPYCRSRSGNWMRDPRRIVECIETELYKFGNLIYFRAIDRRPIGLGEAGAVAAAPCRTPTAFELPRDVADEQVDGEQVGDVVQPPVALQVAQVGIGHPGTQGGEALGGHPAVPHVIRLARRVGLDEELSARDRDRELAAPGGTRCRAGRWTPRRGRRAGTRRA